MAAGSGGRRRGEAAERAGGDRGRAAPAVTPEPDVIRDFPDGPMDATGLTQRQRRILEVIREAVHRQGYPPSVREIGQAVGLTSTSSVAHQLTTLERKGYIRRDPNRPRAVDVRPPDSAAAARGPVLAEEYVEDVFPLPRELVGEGTLFLLRVIGAAMIEAAIEHGCWL